MAYQPSIEQVLVTLLARTVSGSSADIILPDWCTSAIVKVTCTPVTGTTPTLNVYIQSKLGTAAAGDGEQLLGPTGTATYDDFVSFTQITAAATRIARVVGGGNVEHAAADGALTAGSMRNGPIGRAWRIKWVIGGTNPSLTFAVMAQFIA